LAAAAADERILELHDALEHLTAQEPMATQNDQPLQE
jgi:hypothetical protein